jgi:hypothetical protein
MDLAPISFPCFDRYTVPRSPFSARDQLKTRTLTFEVSLIGGRVSYGTFSVREH